MALRNVDDDRERQPSKNPFPWFGAFTFVVTFILFVFCFGWDSTLSARGVFSMVAVATLAIFAIRYLWGGSSPKDPQL
jgi:hypothetical protein